MASSKDIKPHIFLSTNGKAEKYTYPSTGGGSNKRIPEQNRQQHGAKLKAQLEQINQKQQEVLNASESYDLESGLGIQVAFESFFGVEMAVESLADATQGIELLNVRHSKNQVFATIFVPEGKLAVVEKKLQAYIDHKKDKNGKPRDNQKLIDAIQSIRSAALSSLWTDDYNLLPVDHNDIFWWEVWLPVRSDRQAVIHDFKLLAKGANIQVTEHVLEFPERSVLLAKGARKQFASSSLLLSKISELRRAKETAAFFDELLPEVQIEWTDDLLLRLQRNNENPPYICILDSGVNIGHPLIAPFITQTDQFTVNPDWSPTDDDGHGTGMIGLAVWGDLTEPLSSTEQVSINHRLESVKLLRNSGDNEGKHHGIITSDGISLPEIANHARTRIFAMALSSTDGRDRGRPSAWSSTVDSLAADYLGDNQNPRLITVCAGNTGDNLTALIDYPSYNELQDIHDPGQSWNALTVGAFTKKILITEDDANAYSPLAPHGGLSPYSTTSVSWAKPMPIKPEIVFEGGNVGTDGHACAGIPSLKLLTTHNNVTERHFTTFEATSAATALASKFAAEIYAQYPSLWPETVRALLVHSAQWTDAMRQQFTHGTTDRQKAEYLVRCVGFGVPILEKALWSMNNSLALILEDELQPYEKEKGKQPSTRDMHLHDLPWPKDSLEALGEVQVEMTVTLSYFIEPNPSSRNVSGKYSYPSHQLRFDVKRPTESTQEFRSRVSRHARDEEEGTGKAPKDPNWLLGDFRHKGSIHKDVWTGSAVALAGRGQIVVYPAMGWWRTRTNLQKWKKKARYSLVVSIAVPEVDVDLYTEITNKIETPATITTEIQTS
jgi:Subtilase family